MKEKKNIWKKLLIMLILGSLCLGSAFAYIINDDYDIAYYNFEENTSDIIGTNIKTLTTTSRSSQQSAFGDYSGLIDTQREDLGKTWSELGINNQKTITFWFRPLSNSILHDFFSTERYPPGTGQSLLRFHHEGNFIQSYYRKSGTWINIRFESGYSANIWYHYAITYDSGEVKFYLDGNLIGTEGGADSLTNSHSIYIFGRQLHTTTNPYGYVDEILISKNVKTLEEIQSIYNNGISLEQPIPTFLSYNITNSLPVRTNDLIAVNFMLEDNEQPTNVSLTWFKSVDNGENWIQHTTDNEFWENVQLGTLITTTSDGRLEASDTNAFEMWKAQITAINPTGSTAVNTTSITIENDAPQISNSTSGTTNINPANKGDEIIFSVSGTDIEQDNIQLKICSNENATWNNCTVLTQNLTGLSWSSVNPTTITAKYTTIEDIRENTGYAIVYDGGNFSYVNIDYFVNQYPILDNISHVDTNGNTNYFFKESIDYFRIDMIDSFDGTNLTPYITVYDPENVININNQPMTNIFNNTFEYNDNLFLNAVGTWKISVSVTDSDGATTVLNSTFDVESGNITSLGRVYAYDTQTWVNYTTIESLMDDYGFYVIEIHLNNSIMENNWAEFKATVQEVKENSRLVVITLDDDLSNQTRTVNNIDLKYGELIGPNYLNGILMLKIQPDADNTTENTEILNEISKIMFQKTQNFLPIYIKDYVNPNINTNYANPDIFHYVTSNDRSDYINQEINLLRTVQDRSRFYYNLSDTFKGLSRNWQVDVLNRLRSGINTSTNYVNNVAELNNFDLIVANNESTKQTFQISSVNATHGMDIYDLNAKNIVELNTDGIFNVTVEPYSAHILYFTNLEKIVVNKNNQINLFGDALTGYPVTASYGGNAENAFQFVSGSTNPDDGRIFITDPSFKEMDFYVWYGVNGYEAIADWGRYNKVIIGDKTNYTWIRQIGEVSQVFGYVAVETYGNNNMPDGCIPGVDCTSWNRSKWINNKKLEVDSWADIEDTVHLFIDGLDIGAVNDVDDLFGEALIELTNYVRTIRNREVILNTYTAYQDYANLGDYTMRESACARWEGTEQNPTYVYEDIELEKARAKYHKSHNVPVLAQVFGEITDYEKSYYCYMQTKVLYGNLAEISYNQPLFDYTNAIDKFTWNYYKYPDLGVAIEDQYTDNGDGTLTRRFEKGIVTVDTNTKQVEFENNLNVENMEFCGYFYNNDGGVNDAGMLRFIQNRNLSKAFYIDDRELTPFVKTHKCIDIPTELYEPSGWYELEFYYLDYDGNYIGNSGFYVYYGYNESQDQLSFWESVLNDHPSNNKNQYNAYGRGHNWALSLTINATRETPIGEISSAISREESGTEVRNITFSSDTHWNLPIYDKKVFLNKTQWNGIFVDGVNLEPNYDNTCSGNSPIYNSKNIGNGEFKSTLNSLECSGSWGSCEGWTNNGSTAVAWWNTEGSYSIYIGDSGSTSYIEKEFSYLQNLTLDMWVQSGSYLSVYINDELIENYTTIGNNKVVINPNPTANDKVVIIGDGILLDNLRIVTEDYSTWRSCYYEGENGGYDVRVVIPHLSTQTYLVDGNTYPTVDSQSIIINNLLGGNQNITITYNVSDADDNDISACKIEIDESMVDGIYSNGTCLVTFTTQLNSSLQTFTPYVYDEYNGEGSGFSFNSITSVFDKLSWDNKSQQSNQNVQFFWNNYNLSYDWNLSFNNLYWSLNSTQTPILVNLTNGTNNVRFEKNYSLVSESNYSLIPDVNNIYYVNQGKTIWKLLNITNTLNVSIPSFNLSFNPVNYIQGTQSIRRYNGSNWNNELFISGNPIQFNIPSIENGSKEQYNISHQAKVIYTTDDNLVYTQSGEIRTYFFNGTDGLKYNFMFPELLNTGNSIFHNILYSTLPNWQSRTSRNTVMKDNDGNILIENADYILTDKPNSELVELNFAPLLGDTFYRFNLSYTTIIEEPISPPPSSGGGGGGGGGGSAPPTNDLSTGKQICNVFISPKSISLNDGELLQDIRIRNDENFGFDPEFRFSYLSGENDLVDKLRITNQISIVDSGRESLTGVRLSTFFLTSGTAKANLVISSTKCVDILIPIDIEIKQSSGVAEIIKEFSGENKSISQVVVDLSDKSFFGKKNDSNEEKSFIDKTIDKVFSVLGFTLIVGLLTLIFVIPTGSNPTRFSQNTFLDITARFVIWMVVTGIAGIVILVLHIMFFS